MLASSGDVRAATELLEKLSRASSEDYVSPALFGMTWAGMGDKERAFEWLEKACREHDPALASLKVESAVDGLRTDKRFADLLKKVGLSE